MKGTLYIVGTPIGNLKDITLRAVEVLGEVDFVVAESRERALKLLSHLGIHKPITAINSFNEEHRAKSIAAQLANGRTAALISAAGTPCISDPGDRVVRLCYETGVEVLAVPGASAAVAALSVSGLSPDRFLFYGFLPQKTGKKRKILREILSGPYVVVLYESPRRVMNTLEVIQEETDPERMVVVYREMTKVYEEVLRAPVGEVLVQLKEEEPRGEFTIVVEAGAKRVRPSSDTEEGRRRS
jgi:16S rRNA (cytidine1402-2'-O)-methyltransferase